MVEWRRRRRRRGISEDELRQGGGMGEERAEREHRRKIENMVAPLAGTMICKYSVVSGAIQYDA